MTKTEQTHDEARTRYREAKDTLDSADHPTDDQWYEYGTAKQALRAAALEVALERARAKNNPMGRRLAAAG